MVFSLFARVSIQDPWYQWDAVDGWYGSRDDLRYNMEKFMY
jgi:hypothetical protein